MGTPGIFRVDHPFYWKYPIHNLLLCKSGYAPGKIDKDVLCIKIHTDGNSWTSQDKKEKFKKNAQVLIDYIQEKGEEPRSVFYAGKSLSDAGEYTQALYWYQKRVMMKNGFHEEVYYSQYMVAVCKWHMNKSVSEIADEFLKCSELDTMRAEHLYQLQIMYSRNGRKQSAQHIADLLKQFAGRNPYPKRILLLNSNAYKPLILKTNGQKIS